MIPKVFWMCFDDFGVSRSASPLHDSMYKVWAKKSQNFFLILMPYKWVLRCYGRVLTTFVFRGQHIRYMTPCIRYGAKKIENFFFVSNDVKMIVNRFWTCSDDFCFSRSANPLHDSMYKVCGEKIENLFFVSYAI